MAKQLVPEGTHLWIDGWVVVGKYITAIDCYRTSAGPAARWIIEGVYNRRGVQGNLRSVGVDISKIDYSAIALAVSGEPCAVMTWRNKRKQESEPVQLELFYNWLVLHLGLFKPDIVAVEELAVFQSKPTIRTLSRREGVAMLAAKRYGAMVLSPSVGSSRNVVLGIPANSSKEIAWEAVRAKYPDFKFANSNQGGMDEADALVHALAAPTLLERRR